MRLDCIPEVVLFGVLVAVFLRVAMDNRTSRTRLWLGAWAAVFLHFAVHLFPNLLPNPLITFISAATVETAGILFLTSLSAFTDNIPRRWALGLTCGVPIVVYTAAWAWGYKERYIYLFCCMAGVLGLAVYGFVGDRKKRPLRTLLIALPFAAWGIYCSFQSDYFGGITAFATGVFTICGTLFWQRYRRLSTGVVATCAGFFAWAAIFPAILLTSRYAPGVELPGHLWGVPKVVVALGMIVAMLEDESHRASAAGQRYRDLFEHNLAGVFRSTIDGRLLECNDAFVEMYGFASREEAIQAGANNLYSRPEDRTAFVDQLRAEKQLRSHEYLQRRQNGEKFWTLENVVLLEDDPSGVPVIEGTILDISKHKSLEEQLRESQKMEAIGRLAGGIAHDFNNVLMVISSYAELLLDQATPHVKNCANEILKGTQRAAALTRHLLAFSRRQPLEPKIISLNHVLQEMKKILPRLIGEDIACEILEADGLWKVKADAVQVEQVLMNLATNARDAMPVGGRLTIETTNVRGSDRAKRNGMPPGEYVMLSVSDTGEGIRQEVQAHIFEPFFTTKERGKGTGLGLSSVYGFVKQSGGEIFVSSQLGVGTTFRIYLPRCVETPKPSAVINDVAEKNTQGCETIVVVEDEEGIRDSTSRFLRSLGYTVLEAGNGHEAFQVSAEAEQVDLLLSDILIPGVSGQDLAQMIVNIHPDMRILYMSGYADVSATRKDHAGLSRLQKPFTMEALARKVREALSEVRDSSNLTGSNSDEQPQAVLIRPN